MKVSFINNNKSLALALVLLLSSPAHATNLPPAEAVSSHDSASELESSQLPPSQYSPDKLKHSYLDAIADIENRYGPYHTELPQHLMGLGVSYQQQGKHEEAAEIFQRAMHVSRISEGLYSLSQVPMLDHLIESTMAKGDWEEADNNHQYLYWLYKRNYGENDPRMLPAMLKVSSWHLKAYTVEPNDKLLEHLIKAHNTYTQAVNLISRHYGPYDLRLIEALKGLTASNYYLATYQAAQANRGEFQATFSNNRAAINEQARLEQYILQSYSSGSHAIARMHEVYTSNPDAPAGADMIAQVQLGDWNLLFNRWHTAMELYQTAYHSMANSAEGEAKASEYFSKPVALPDLPLLRSSLEATDDSSHYVLVRFDVTSNGVTENVHIVESHPEKSSRNRAQVRRALQKAKFRPRLVNGAPVDTEQLTHRYVFAN